MHRMNAGFSLVELMVTIAIIAIVTVMAVPSFTSMVNSNRASSLANQMASSFNMARSEAIKRGVPATACTFDPTTDMSGTLNCAGTTHWNSGWLLFVDKNGDGAFTAGSDTALKVGQPSLNNVTTMTTTVTAITYLASGVVQGGVALSFNLCIGSVSGQSMGSQRTVNISTTGRVTITKPNSGVC